MECLRCKSANPEGQHYCGNCGTLLDPALGPLRDALEASLRSQLTSLAERWKDQKVVEEETEKAIRKELVESARKIGRRVAVAVILWSLLMAFLAGVAYKEFGRRVAAAKSDIAARSEQLRNQIEANRPGITVGTASQAELRKQIQVELDERLKDRKQVETEMAEAVVTKVSDWAKLMAFFVGIPLAVLAVGLGFWGVKTFQDFSRQVDALLDGSVKQITEQARTETDAARQRLHAVVDELQRSTDATQLRVEEVRGRVEEVRAESERFLAQFPEVRKLAGEVAGLSTKVQQIEDKISIAYRGALTKAEAKNLSETLESFRAYMRDIGYHDQPGSLKVVVRRELEGGSPAYYAPNEHRMYVASPFVGDSDAVFMQYVHHVLERPGERGNAYTRIQYGLALYFPCSFHSDPLFAKVTAKIWKESREGYRNLVNSMPLTGDAMPEAEGGEAWGGAFWEVRGAIGQTLADRSLFAAWSALKQPDFATDDGGKELIVNLLEECRPAGESRCEDVRAIFQHRGLEL